MQIYCIKLQVIAGCTIFGETRTMKKQVFFLLFFLLSCVAVWLGWKYKLEWEINYLFGVLVVYALLGCCTFLLGLKFGNSE